ncbi:hypothetical protein Q4520_18120 [Alteromonas sp. 1_MG-2023]|uniref:hypothetical protein n=1 Tax=Alteromonas sp. 1_MG-2023 TaxID=3062669 RepID=UPI0026E1E352|nr:hypothetical protein [Alteromonas sp. 1_MG-2023]MDO6477343.1 hypothetical protein [Alteromonas sp. 1_MG-2023]
MKNTIREKSNTNIDYLQIESVTSGKIITDQVQSWQGRCEQGVFEAVKVICVNG